MSKKLKPDHFSDSNFDPSIPIYSRQQASAIVSREHFEAALRKFLARIQQGKVKGMPDYMKSYFSKLIKEALEADNLLGDTQIGLYITLTRNGNHYVMLFDSYWLKDNEFAYAFKLDDDE